MEFDLMSSLDPVAVGRWLEAKKRGGCGLGGGAKAQHSAAVRGVDVTLPRGRRPRGGLGWGPKYKNGTSHKGGFPL
eukprot:1161918-Pelagomonas_calceolata.AAC.5